MKNPEDRSPEEWAEEARDRARNLLRERAWTMTRADVEELAARMDDLSEAIRLLRVWLGSDPWKPALADAKALLAKYEEDGDE